MPPSHRDRVKALYEKYDPAKLPQLDATMTKYAGKEAKMIEALVKKYGPEPTPTSSPAQTPRGKADDSSPRAPLSYRDRVKALYEKYDPAKLPQLDATMTKYAGKEEKVIEALVKKYGPEPEPATPKATPRQEAAPAAAAATKEPAVAQRAPLSYRDRVKALYEKYDPAKLPQLDATMTKYAGKEEKVIEALVKKYGPEPEPKTPIATPRQEAAPAAAAATKEEKPAAAQRAPLSYRDRVKALYEKYDPAKLPQLDATMTKYAGKEAKMIEALVKKYGPEPDPSTPIATPRQEAAPAAKEPKTPTASAPREPLSYRDRVKALYEKYDPAKLPQLDATMTKYAGKEAKMIEALVKKYGPEPDPTTPIATPRQEASPAAAAEPPAAKEEPAPSREPLSYRDRVKALYEKYDPAKLPQLDATMTKYAGKEAKMIEALVKKYGPEPDPSTPKATPRQEAAPAAAAAPEPAAQRAPLSYRDRVKALYEKYDPAKLPQLNATMTKYVGKEARIIEALVKRYGPEPDPSTPIVTPRQEAAPTATEKPAPAPREPLSYRDRVKALYEKYDPAKLPQLDATMTKYAGKEAKMIEALVKKYGPEPAPEESAAATSSSPVASDAPAPAAAAAHDDESPVVTPGDESGAPSGEQSLVARVSFAGLEEPQASTAQADEEQEDAPSTPCDEQPAAAPAPQQPQQQPTQPAVPAQEQAQEPQVPSAELEKLRRTRDALMRRAVEAIQESLANGARSAAFKFWKRWATEHGRQRKVDALVAKEQAVVAGEWAVDEVREEQTASGEAGAVKRVLVNKRTGRTVDVEAKSDVSQPAAEDEPRPVAPVALIEALSDLPTSELFYPLLPAPTNVDDVLAAVAAARKAIVDDLPAALTRAEEAEVVAAGARAAEQAAVARRGEAERELLNTTELLAEERATTQQQQEELQHAMNDIDELSQHVRACEEHIDFVSAELQAERAGIPTAIEDEVRRKDELAAHLHTTLASSRTKVRALEEQVKTLSEELRRARALNDRFRHQQGRLASPGRQPSLTAPTFSSSRKQLTPRGGAGPSSPEHARRPSADGAVHPSLLAGHAFRHPDAPGHLAPVATKNPASMSPPPYHVRSGHGGGSPKKDVDDDNDVEVIPMDASPPGGQQAGPSTAAQERDGSTDSDFSPTNRSAVPSRQPTAASLAGVNETPAPEGASPAPRAPDGTTTSEPRDEEKASRVRTAADDLDDFLPEDQHADGQPAEDFGGCPACGYERLTPFYGSRVGGADGDKVAFCFSCRTAFTRKDLYIRDVRRENQIYSSTVGSRNKKSMSTGRVAKRRS